MSLFQFTLPFFALAFSSAASAQNVGTAFCSPTNNSTGFPALLKGTTGSAVGSDLHLEVTQGVPSEFGYFLVGNQNAVSLPISNGWLCLGGNSAASLYRFNVGTGVSNSLGVFDAGGLLQNISGTSTVGTGYDVPVAIPDTVPIVIMSGDTWHFQFWYRDTPAASGSSNFSSGLSVTFPPVALPTPIAGMVPIPAGTFNMGSNAAAGPPYYGLASTQPVHSVTFSSRIWMGQFEVTQAEYQALMGVNPSFFGGAILPVEQVSWHDARAYCAALTAQETALGHLPAGYEYRLPTEAEWEFACRAGTTTEFHVGNALDCPDAMFTFSYHSNSSCLATSTRVGSYAPNALGLYDMHGNVWEWCLDTYAAYGAGAVVDPLVTSGSGRTLRGGSWIDGSNVCRSAGRNAAGPGDAHNWLGFRVVLGGVLVP